MSVLVHVWGVDTKHADTQLYFLDLISTLSEWSSASWENTWLHFTSTKSYVKKRNENATNSLSFLFIIIKGERTTGVVWVTAFGLLSGECKSEVWRTQWAAPCGAEELLGKLENQETWLTFFFPTESVYLCLHVE